MYFILRPFAWVSVAARGGDRPRFLFLRCSDAVNPAERYVIMRAEDNTRTVERMLTPNVIE